ncbi:class E sortase [Streptomyces viridochromogenes]|uniref:Putative Integral membrane protein n=1 Tax=Streptomyces viridochromogenes Tue57 TaxID=1160705 RepID=L8PEP3_STRVR|nr:class E sortase [Streptomyces viridochromogenes]ELS54644.1 putative Integral membrane protein [Streptomyces viridochromogenes Tue57]
MTALRPERESGAAYGDSFTESYGDVGDQGTSYGQEPYGASGALGEWHGAAGYVAPEQGNAGYGTSDGYGGEGYAEPYIAPVDDETVALRIPDPPAGEAMASSAASSAPSAAGTTGTNTGGRAARRKAAKRRHGRHGGSRQAAEAVDSDSEAPQAPLSRVEARRQARARKPSPGVLASRAIGEVFITTGVLMLLFVSYQLWWTNVRAHAQADKEASSLQEDWASGKRNPGVFEPGQGFAILHIPKLDVVVPIAEGISNKKVLDRGMVGHYGEGKLKTAMPDAKTGNFGLAGHRNTHGEPFRYINRLSQGDAIVVETQDKYFVYKMASILPVTSPSNVSVLDPIPPGSGFTKPGRYITLTTCTPEFTSKYRLIVWGKMVEERPRSKGKPDALVS